MLSVVRRPSRPNMVLVSRCLLVLLVYDLISMLGWTSIWQVKIRIRKEQGRERMAWTTWQTFDTVSE